MAKLCRIHFAGMGNISARFNPLTLNFEGEDEKPAHTVLWLRNGGGKTTMLSLFYSVLLPSKREWLGKYHEKPTELSDYMFEKEVGYILIEFAFADGSRRIVGQSLIKRSAQEVSRICFTLRSDGPVSLAALPIVGLAASPAKTREAFFAFLDAENKKDPRGVELYKFELPQHPLSEWERHLVEIGVDPQVYRSHLVMNSDEGGLGEFFDFKTSDKFIEKLLYMADDPNVIPDDPNATDQTEEFVSSFRAKVLGMPDLEKEARFCQLVADGTRQYRVASVAAQAASRALMSARIEAAKALCSVQACLEDLKTRQAALELNRQKFVSDQQAAESTLNTHGKYRQSYDRQSITLRHEEAQRMLAQCKLVDATARHDLATLKAAEKLADLDYWRGVVVARQRELTMLMENRRPDLEEVSNLGTTLWIKLNSSVEAARSGIDELKRQLEENKAELNCLAKALTQYREKLTRFSRDLAAVLENVKNADRDRRKLREDGVIADGESAPEALGRLTKEIARIQEQIAQKTEDVRIYKNRARGFRDEAKVHRNNASKAAQDAAMVQTKLRAVVSAEEQLISNRCIQKHGGSTPDFRNPGLLQALKTEGDTLGAAIVSRAVGRAADERILARHAPPNRPTFPIPIAVERVLELLRAKGVRSAISRYDWINANFGLGEAEALLKNNPAAGAGILLQDPAELHLATQLTSADGIDTPIALSVLSAETAHPTAVHVILPAERGYFNAAVAAASRGLVEERVNSSQRDQDRLDGSRKEVDRAAHSLQDYMLSYPSETVTEWRADLERHLAKETELETQAVAADELAASSEEQANLAQTDIERLRADLSANEHKSYSLNKYITDYHSRLDGWKREESLAQDGIKTAERDIRDATENSEGLSRRNEEINTEIHGRLSDLERLKQRRDNVPARYRDGTVDPGAQDIEALENLFQVKKDSLDRVISGSGLPASIKVAEDGLTREQATYDQLLLTDRLKDADVRAARELHPNLKAAVSAQIQTAKQFGEELTLADQEARQAKLTWDAIPPLLRDDRATVHPEWGAAITKAQADELVRRCLQVETEMAEKKEDATRQLATLKERASEMNVLTQTLKPWPEELVRACGGQTSLEGHSRFVADANVGELLKATRAEVESQSERYHGALGRANEAFTERILAILNNADYAAARMDIRGRLIELTANRSQFDSRIDDILTGITERISVIEHSQSELESQRKLVIQAMESRGSAAITMLRSAQRLSEMPTEIPAWAGHCFMRFSVPEKRDATERESYLRRLLQYWIETNSAIPRGHVMAFECLMALVGSLDGSGKPAPKGSIGVEILKPEANLKFFYHDILVMRTFSGGELVTTAIILYCVMARLRAKRRGADTSTLSKDSGFLLLDNPVGKANLPDFLDLQIRIADILGVQYICGTGINDIEALGAFPKVIRMRNSTINPRTGANIVQVAKEITNSVTAIQVAAKTPVLARKTRIAAAGK